MRRINYIQKKNISGSILINANYVNKHLLFIKYF